MLYYYYCAAVGCDGGMEIVLALKYLGSIFSTTRLAMNADVVVEFLLVDLFVDLFSGCWYTCLSIRQSIQAID